MSVTAVIAPTTSADTLNPDISGMGYDLVW